MRSLRIAMIAPFGIRPKGTLAARMLPLAVQLCRRGHAVTIVAPAYLNPADAATRQVVDGIEVVHAGLPRAPAPFSAVETAVELARVAWQFEPDVLHVFKPKVYGGLAALV